LSDLAESSFFGSSFLSSFATIIVGFVSFVILYSKL
jgi:hypothetical protein